MFASLLTSLGLILFNFGSTSIQSYICQPPDKPSITQPADASSVTAGGVTVSGIATASSLVTISVDGQSSVQVTADAYNTFSGQVLLDTGAHTLQVASNSPCGNSTGDPIAVLATPPDVPPTPPGGNSGSPASPTSSAPSAGTATSSSPGGPTTGSSGSSGLSLHVTTPRADSRVTGASVYVSGTASAPAKYRILVGGTERAKTLVASPTFGLTVPLQTGPNEIVVQASTDTDQASATLTITRVDTSSPAGSATSKPWWRTAPGIIAISVVTLLMLGLLIWLVVVH